MPKIYHTFYVCSPCEVKVRKDKRTGHPCYKKCKSMDIFIEIKPYQPIEESYPFDETKNFKLAPKNLSRCATQAGYPKDQLDHL
jgi:hypothetical protein